MKKIYDYEKYKSIFMIDSRLTKEYFMAKCSTENGSYASGLFSRMYDSIMSEITYLDDEYDHYYNVEYMNFKDFLHRKYNLPLSVCEELVKTKISNPTFKVCEKDDFACGHYQMFELAFSESMIDRVFDILQMNDYEN